MKVIKPVGIGPDELVSSNAPDDAYPEYSETTDYPVGARVIYEDAVYESVQAPNVGHTPGADPLYWAAIGATNRWLMFDSEVSTQTVAPSPLEVVVAPGIINSVALLELVGTHLDIVARDGAGGPVIYEYSRQLEDSVVTDWYEYFFEPFTPISELVLTNLPPYGSIHLEVTLSAPLAEVRCGAMICGTAYDIGDAEYGGTAGIVDYSRKTTSETGVTRFQRRRFSRRMTQRLWLDAGMLNKVYRLLSELRATPCVWIGTDSEGFGPFVAFGFYRDFNIDVAYPLVHFCNLEIEGLT